MYAFMYQCKREIEEQGVGKPIRPRPKFMPYVPHMTSVTGRNCTHHICCWSESTTLLVPPLQMQQGCRIHDILLKNDIKPIFLYPPAGTPHNSDYIYNRSYENQKFTLDRGCDFYIQRVFRGLLQYLFRRICGQHTTVWYKPTGAQWLQPHQFFWTGHS